jgi:hypothetical protein
MSIAISITALAFSCAVFAHSRWRDKRDLFLQLHDQLVATDKQKGRRLLYEMAEQQLHVEDLSENDYLTINNMLAAFNVMGIYYQRRYVSRRDVLELWAVPLVRTLPAAKHFMEHRDVYQGVPSWPQYRALCDDAKDYVRHKQIPVRVPQQPLD